MPCEPTDPSVATGCTSPKLEDPNNGTGYVPAALNTGPILPDTLDMNGDGIPDVYDGPAEFDDLPSSIYHARSVHGLGYGGDGRPGEVTSTRNTAIYGQDFGLGYPDAPPDPDGSIPAGGPLAYNVHGTNGYDAGNVLNLEYLTWWKGAKPLTSLSLKKTLAWEGAGVNRLYTIESSTNKLFTISLTSDPNDPNDPGGYLWSFNPNDPNAMVEKGALNSDPNNPVVASVAAIALATTFPTLPGDPPLYGIGDDPSAKHILIQINKISGTATKKAELKLQSGVAFNGQFKDLAYGYVKKTGETQPKLALYVLAEENAGDGKKQSTLYRIDPNNPNGLMTQITALGRAGYTSAGAQGLACDPKTSTSSLDDVFYTIDLTNQRLARIDFTVSDPNNNLVLPDPNDPNVPAHIGFSVQALTLAPGNSVAIPPKRAQLFALTTDADLVGINVLNGDPDTIGGFPVQYELMQVFHRDRNLDGLLDMGEVRDPNTENYVVDMNPISPNDGGPWSNYPFSRRRLTEDVVAALTDSVKWDDVVWRVPQSGGAVKNFVHSVILLPSGIYPDGLAAGGRGLFQLPAPSMNLPITIHEDAVNPLSPIYFSDFATALSGASETGEPLDGYGKQLMCHEWLHVWEGYPDLYDYDEYDPGGIINRPVGVWDIMSGGWVHPSPPLKLLFTGFADYGTYHTPWIQARDLTEVLQPSQQSKITLPDYAFNPSDSVYYYYNYALPGELFFFWRATHDFDPNDPSKINFYRYAPGEGVLIMHTDFGMDPESRPPQQRIGTHFTYNIVQADGLHQLEHGVNNGDAGDPFPGSTGRKQWNDVTDPSSKWWAQMPSGLSITDIQEQSTYSEVTFFWDPHWVPTLRFTAPPGGDVVYGNYTLKYEAFDFFGGTKINLYIDPNSSGHGGTKITPVPPQTNPQSKAPGPVQGAFSVPLSGLSDTSYYFYAWLDPEAGSDGNYEPWYSWPRPGANNRGRGSLDVYEVNVFDPNDPNFPGPCKLETWTVTCTDDSVAGQEKWTVTGSVSGSQSQKARTGVYYRSDEDEIAFVIDSDPNNPAGAGASVSNAGGIFKLTDAAASFVASDFKVGDMVRIIAGPLPGFYTILSVPDPHTLRLGANPGSGGGVSYRVHCFTAGGGGSPGDVYTFMTTGLTPYSSPICVRHGQVIPTTAPLILVSYPDDATNPGRQAPLRVTFDGSQSRDAKGKLNPDLKYLWQFDDGQKPTQSIVTHTYQVDGTFPVSLTVTSPNLVKHPITGVMFHPYATATINIEVEPADTDGDGIPDSQDNCPTVPNGPAEAGIPGVGNQTDTDGDGVGDACDNCPTVPNGPAQAGIPGIGNQTDSDHDGLGDACDNDWDNDGVPNSSDNCPYTYNPGQEDGDHDGVGDACDNCPGKPNPDQSDIDKDGVGDVCDNCPTHYNPNQNDPADDCNHNSMPDECDIDAGLLHDCNGDLRPDECVPPLTVSVGPDIQMAPGTIATLMSNVQTTGISTPLIYSWQIISPAGATGLTGTTSANAVFTQTTLGSYVIRCTVRSGVAPGSCSAFDELTVTVVGLTVNVQSQMVGCVGMPTLPLGGSPTASGGKPPYTYEWSIISGPPAGGNFDPAVRGLPNPTFTPPVTGTYTARLKLTDSSTPKISVERTLPIVVSDPPTASAGIAETYHPIIVVGDQLPLGGEPTASGGHPPYTYSWTIPSNEGGAGTISDSSSPNPVFIAYAKGAFVIHLDVVDAGGCTASTECSVTVVTDPPASTLPPGTEPSTTTPSACGATCGPAGVLTTWAVLAGFACMYAGRRRWRARRGG
ncbi:MAG TPA: thrombospondin type 3 repeat-containing protein [Phycisphaerae bacterium]|nr:thrombospondin type 3 repeat-containing protein [Phycisphaerae bacterium]